MAFGHQMVALWAPWVVKLKFGALFAPSYSSCGGLVAFGHQMGAFPIGYPQNFVKIGLDLAEILRISKLDWCDGGGEGKKEGRNPAL